MIIILEGENKTGKTTLAHYIRDNHNFKYVKCNQPKGSPYDEYIGILEGLSYLDDLVIDRFCYGELVYGPIYRGKSALSEKELIKIESRLHVLEARLIYCKNSIEDIQKLFDKEKEEFANKDKVKETLELYDEVISCANIPIFFHQMKTKSDMILNPKRLEFIT